MREPAKLFYRGFESHSLLHEQHLISIYSIQGFECASAIKNHIKAISYEKPPHIEGLK